MKIEEVVQQIITKEIPSGKVFDSHTVINILIEKYSDIYLRSFCRDSTELYHGYIGQCISQFNNTLVDQRGESWSKNIHGEYSSCTYWLKL